MVRARLLGWLRHLVARKPRPTKTLVLLSAPRPMGLGERSWSREEVLRRIPEPRPYLGPYGRPYRPTAEYLALCHGIDRSLATLARMDGQEPYSLAQLAEWPRLLVDPVSRGLSGSREGSWLN